MLRQKKTTEAPKILQAITLAKAMNDRGLGSTIIKNTSSVTSTNPTRNALVDQNKFLKPSFDQTDHILEKKELV